MPDEDIRALERAAVNASPEVVAWLRALTKTGQLPPVPLTPPPPITVPLTVSVEVDDPLYVLHDPARNVHHIRINMDAVTRIIMGRIRANLEADGRDLIEGIRRAVRANPITRQEFQALLGEFSAVHG